MRTGIRYGSPEAVKSDRRPMSRPGG